jgi:thymidylate synthase (FAD)
VTSGQKTKKIDEKVAATAKTLRPTVPALESLLFEAIPLLDHGFIRVMDYMGDDSAIVQAARVSYGRGTKRLNEDRGLIRYLMSHHHSTPFEMCELKIHVKLPIFVARQWIRHRTANVNEYSARYSVLDKEFYIPTADQLATQSTANRQGRDALLSPNQAAAVQSLLRDDANLNYEHYLWLLNEGPDGQLADPDRLGLARELARIGLGLGTYTQWYWKIDLHNLLRFLRLRADAHAQYEIRVYADVLLDVVRRWVPLTHEAFLEYQLNAATLSATAVSVLQRRLAGELVAQESSGLSKREWADLVTVFDLN